MQSRSLRDTSANERSRLAFGIEYCRNRVTASFTDYDYNLALAVLVPGKATVAAVYFLISWFDVTAIHLASHHPDDHELARPLEVESGLSYIVTHRAGKH